MEKTMFFIWLKNKLQPVLTRITNTVNGNAKDPVYLYMKYLTNKRFSLDLKWGTMNINGSAVAADLVTQDASVPLKKRDSLGIVTGEVPKLGMKFRKSEREMQDLQTLQETNKNGRNNEIITNLLFQDPIRGVNGIRERLEYMFLQGFSSGFTETTDDYNEGASIRIDYGYKSENSFQVAEVWSDTSATPLTDINMALTEARTKGRSPLYMFMDPIAFNNFKSKSEVKELYAAGLSFAGTNIPTPNFEQVNNALAGSGYPQIIVIDRYITFEKNGIRQNVKPWKDASVVLVDSIDLGDITWSTLVEANAPSPQSLYSVADDHTLISIYRTTDPYSETTSAQALAVPVIYNVDGIFVISSEDKYLGILPTVDAGIDQTVSITTATMAATATAANGKTISTKLWTKVSGASASITSPASLTTGITGLAANGNYVFKLTITDSLGAVSEDTVTITRTGV